MAQSNSLSAGKVRSSEPDARADGHTYQMFGRSSGTSVVAQANADWSFLTNHARAILFLASGGDSRLRDIAGALDVTERTAHSIISDLTDAGYVANEKSGRRNVYHIQAHLPLHDSNGERAIGELLSLFHDTESGSS